MLRHVADSPTLLATWATEYRLYCLPKQKADGMKRSLRSFVMETLNKTCVMKIPFKMNIVNKRIKEGRLYLNHRLFTLDIPNVI